MSIAYMVFPVSLCPARLPYTPYIGVRPRDVNVFGEISVMWSVSHGWADPIGAAPMGHTGDVGGWVTGRIGPIGGHDADQVGVNGPIPFAPHDHDVGQPIGRTGHDVSVVIVRGINDVVAFRAPITDAQIGAGNRAIGNGVHDAVNVIGGFNVDVHGGPIGWGGGRSRGDDWSIDVEPQHVQRPVRVGQFGGGNGFHPHGYAVHNDRDDHVTIIIHGNRDVIHCVPHSLFPFNAYAMYIGVWWVDINVSVGVLWITSCRWWMGWCRTRTGCWSGRRWDGMRSCPPTHHQTG